MLNPGRRRAGPAEFIGILAMSMGLSGLGIDIMLPALASIRTEFGLASDDTSVALLLTTYFLGLAGGQIIYGTLSDRFGRRPLLMTSIIIYLAASFASVAAPSLTMLIVSRFVWGLGAAGARALTVAMVRDTFAGEKMARSMSLIMAIFILVPVVAPLIGSMVIAVASWRWVFGVCVVFAILVGLWALVRLPETLPPERRLELTFRRVATAAHFVLRDRQARGYGLALMLVSGAFYSYLASSELVIGEILGRADLFPIIFAILSAIMGIGMLLNSRMVGWLGTRRLAHGVLVGYLAFATAFLLLSVVAEGQPPIWLFSIGVAPLLISHAFLIPNLNTIAMSNMAPVAGTASAIIGTAQIAGGALLGAIIDRAYAGTITPLAIGFLASGAAAFVLVLAIERGKLFRRLPPPTEPPIPPIIEG